MVNKILFYSLDKISELIKDKSISSIELTTIFYNHISKYHKDINCITDLKPIKEALAEAELADKDIKAGLYKGPLHGIPLTVKDSFNVKGLKSSNGYPLLKNNISSSDAQLIKQIKNAGGIIIGKTNLPMFAIDWISDNFWYGKTNNPYDLSRTPGGSSGGSAAALASGFTPIELGSDAGGSIRVPAHFCGICGLRPTDGLLSNDGQFDFPGHPKGLRYITVPGPMARNITDLKTFFDILCPQEASSNQPPICLKDYSTYKDTPLKIAYSNTLNNVEIDNEYHKVFSDFIEKLKKNGHTLVESQPLYDHNESYINWATLMGFDFGINLPGIILERTFMRLFMHFKYFDPLWTKGLLKGMSGNVKSYSKALQYREVVSESFYKFLTEFDIWITPVSSDCAFKHQRTGKAFRINNKKVEYTEALATFNFPTAFAGHPICSIPIGTIKNGMPVGIQIHCKKWEDKRLLQIALNLEKLTDGYKIPNMFNVHV